MLKSISSADFFETLVIVTCIYYVVVLIRYYRKEISTFWKSSRECL
ncbi:MAG TPA: hypothetical protein VGM89_03690 [Puia sp.]